VVDMLASGGNPDPPTWSRVFWGVAEGAVAAALLTADPAEGGALTALQTMAIVIAFPFSIVMIGMCMSTYREFSAERTTQLNIQRRLQRDELTEHVSRSLTDNGLVAKGAGAEPDRPTEGSQA
jgi:choline/glycine/proline betaine transport protein